MNAAYEREIDLPCLSARRHIRLLGISIHATWTLLIVFALQLRVWGFAHLWDINEIYSNADGSVQFIELTNNSISSGERFVSGLTMTVSSALGTNVFTLPTDLSGGTLNKTFLIATPGFGSVPGGVAPDYVWTNTGPFFFAAGGTVNFANFDAVNYTNLPIDGTASLVRSGAAMVFAAVNSPRNFADETNSIVSVRFTSIAKNGANVALSFPTATGPNGTAGPNYTVQRNDNPSTTNWSIVTNVTGDGTLRTVTAPITGPQRLFRLRVP